ncbi:FAD-dependent tricarballylate dehydrogenase TcuA [Egibacter rhizosphaerae]|uniref:FAD-dependent tricarballylate dehydrogenase TcuA n=1 Tax=Egibacter rhizosphaerae TaxID=1670831 RepID=UPI0013F16B75|nr:FAD-dependent tricarballylate dehydrogenase TcuA [Egibacter rhizosphaerae]
MANDDYDVIVVGAGNAALVAALSAHEAGARVLVLEAAPKEERGGNSRFAGAIFRIAHDGPESLRPLLDPEFAHWVDQVEVGPYPAEEYYADAQATSGGRADPQLLDLLISRSYETVEWMRDRGVRWELTVGKLVDPDKIDPDETYVLPAGGALRVVDEGVGLMTNLFEAVERAGIEVWYESPADDLLTQGNTVTGVRVRGIDRDIDLHGTVVLAAGGFEANPEMRERYLGSGWDLVKVRGTRFNTGTMLQKALDAGAQPEGHWGGCHASPLDADAPKVGDLSLTDKMSRYSYPYSLLVNIEGQRFVDEGEDEVWLTYAKTGGAIRRQPQALAAQIFDQKTVHLLEPRYETGTPVEADTLAELAGKLGIPVHALEQTVEEFNAATKDGGFDPFSKDGLRAEPQGQPVKSNWAVPLDQPPYVAYRVTCGITFTYGGVRIDEQARVIDTAGRPMHGLYATGELTGGFFYHNYPAGAGLTRGAVVGRIAGDQAAAHAKK